jgi:hypothetical protein
MARKVRLGESVSHQRLRITPLYSISDSVLDYVLFDETVAGTLIEVIEVSRGGSVPELLVRNRAKVRVLLPDGTTLIGSKQNRVVNVSIMLAPLSETVIPVSCVERGRWSFSSPQSSPSEYADKELRRQMCSEATEGLQREGKVQVSQSGVWCHVDKMLKGAGAYSPSNAYHAVHEKWNQQLSEYQERLPWPDNSTGVAVEVDGKVETIELFDKPDTLRRLWPRLLRSYAVGALASRGLDESRTACGTVAQSEVSAFLSRAVAGEAVKSAPLGAGTSLRISSLDSVGAALVCENQLVHLSVFANRNGGSSSATDMMSSRGETAPNPSPNVERPSETPPNPSPNAERPGRPWWRFWM